MILSFGGTAFGNVHTTTTTMNHTFEFQMNLQHSCLPWLSSPAVAVLTGAVHRRSAESSEGSGLRLGSRLISLAGCSGFTDSCVSASLWLSSKLRAGPSRGGAKGSKVALLNK